MTLQTRNDRVLQTLTPFLVALPEHAALLDQRPFGVQIAPEHVIDPTKLSAADFLLILQEMDRLTFGPEGMPMPRWVFYNGAEIPGAIFGFAAKREQLPADVVTQLKTPENYDGLIPVSMFIAIPAAPPRLWFGHNLASLNPQLPSMQLRGLASITKALGLKCFRCQSQLGATQWDSDALHIHTRFGPLSLVTTWTPTHSSPWTLTYRFEVTDEKLLHALGDPRGQIEVPAPTLWVPRKDEALQQRLQHEVEAGARYVICGRPRGSDMEMEVPIAALS